MTTGLSYVATHPADPGRAACFVNLHQEIVAAVRRVRVAFVHGAARQTQGAAGDLAQVLGVAGVPVAAGGAGAARFTPTTAAHTGSGNTGCACFIASLLVIADSTAGPTKSPTVCMGAIVDAMS